MSETGKLVLIPTPLGNLEDITLRALNTLKEVDLLLCEDTRHTGKLLKHFDIQVPTRSFHQHNEHKVTQQIVDELLNGKYIGQVSDAGTPGISDPGFLLAREAAEQGIEVICLPGPAAFVPAIVASGLPCDRFYFGGFLPHKKGRQTRMKDLAEREETLILYESPHRIERTLRELMEHLGPERKACVSREISKLHETHHRGTLQELHALAESGAFKGEIVLSIEGK